MKEIIKKNLFSQKDENFPKNNKNQINNISIKLSKEFQFNNYNKKENKFIYKNLKME